MRKTYILNVFPGIKRDGTTFASRNYTDGQHVRYQRGLPRKMGGYKEIIDSSSEITYGMFVTPNNPNFEVYQGTINGLTVTTINGAGNQIGSYSRTPVPFPINANTLWTFDLINSDPKLILAQPTRNLNSIDSNVEVPVYYGPVNATTPLISTEQESSGGVVVLHPYVFYFGEDVKISNAGDPTTILLTATPTGQKIVAGLPARGGNSSPAGLLWSLDSVIRVTFIGPPQYFVFDTVTTESSMLSSRSVVEYDNLYFWAATDRFLYYNGSVQEIKNDMNINYFFDNLNYGQRQKVWATKITRFGEIWWHYPFGDSTECNRAIVYNVRENVWYDSSESRASGYFDQIFKFPLWASSELNENDNYGIWMHEFGKNQISFDGTVSPILSKFKTGSIAFCAIGPDGQSIGLDKRVELYRVEPDFRPENGVTGNMTMRVYGKSYANQDSVELITKTFTEDDVKIDTRVQYREMYIEFESNEIDGDYQMGNILLDIGTGDTRP